MNENESRITVREIGGIAVKALVTIIVTIFELLKDQKENGK